MKIQEASEDFTRKRNLVPSPKINHMEENTQKMKKQSITLEELHSCALGVNHAPRSRKKTLMRPHVWYAPSGCSISGINYFLLLFGRRNTIFKIKPS